MPSSTLVSTTLDLVDPQFGDLFDYRFGERLEGAGDNGVLVGVMASSIKTLFWMSSSLSASLTLKSSIS